MLKSFVFAALGAFCLASASAQTITDGLKAMDVERYGDAGRIFRQLGATGGADVAFYTGYLYAVTDKPDSAKLFFDLSNSKDPKYALAKIGLGTVQILAGNKAAAKPLFDEAKKLSKDKSAEVFYRIGEAYTIYKTTDAPEAIAHLQKAAELDPKRADVQVLLGDAFLLMNDGSLANTAYDKAIRINPNYTEAYIHSGQVLERARSYSVAYNRYTEGMKKDSSYTPGYRYLAELQRKAKKQPEAIANYRKYIDRSDRNPEALLRFAGFLMEAGQYQEAAQYIAQVEGKTKSPIYGRLAAYSKFETGDVAGAATALNQFMQTVDTNRVKIAALDYLYLGKIEMANTKDTAKALGYFTQALAKDSTVRDNLKMAADTAYARKDYKGAARIYNLAIATGGSASEYFRAGQAFYYAKEYKKADTAFAKVTEVSKGRNPSGLLMRGYANQAQDPQYKTGQAKPYFQEFIKATTDTALVPLTEQPKFAKQRATAYAYLAVLYAAKNERKEAEREAENALKEDPTNKQALQLKEQLAKPAPSAAPTTPAAPDKKKPVPPKTPKKG